MEWSSRVATTPWKPRNVIFFFKKFEIDEIEFCPYAEKKNHSGFVNISPTLVIDRYVNGKVFTSSYYNMGTKKFDFFFSKKFAIEFNLYFDLC